MKNITCLSLPLFFITSMANSTPQQKMRVFIM